MSGTVVLAFSGGLDTSFCVPWLIERGYDVVTLFVDTGGVDAKERAAIEARAMELGASEHVVHDAGGELWDSFVVPFVMGGVCYQDQYPLLCSDRYVIVSESVKLAERIGAVGIAHGCTAMGNDQVRFDHSIRCLTDLPIIAPIREIQGESASPRAYEIEHLRSRGFGVSESVKRYTINRNALGVTISGSEIDSFGAPASDCYQITAGADAWPRSLVRAQLGFEEGCAITLDGEPASGPELLQELNSRFGICGVGRGVYTGDTVIGLKGRIVFEAPGLVALLTAHRALEETVLTRAQNGFKPMAARRWTELVYSGAFYEPLREDLGAFIRSTQRRVSGEVTLESAGGSVDASEVSSPAILVRAGASYAQHADWSAADAEGFIKLSGLSSAIATDVARSLAGKDACSIAS